MSEIVAGIDVGSRTIKVVVLDAASATVVASGLVGQGVAQARIGAQLFDRTLRSADVDRSQVAGIVATGYGRDSLPFADTTITEITCQAAGVSHQHPAARTVVDIGGQDSKLLRLDAPGRVRDFVMNDRCAAGTGRFLEVVAQRLGIDLVELGGLAATAAHPAAISSMCVVFAETEIIGLLASGTSSGDIAAGVQHAMSARIASMAARKVEEPVVLTGGVALVPGMRSALAQALNHPVQTAHEPQLTAALGAALLARSRRRSSARE